MYLFYFLFVFSTLTTYGAFYINILIPVAPSCDELFLLDLILMDISYTELVLLTFILYTLYVRCFKSKRNVDISTQLKNALTFSILFKSFTNTSNSKVVYLKETGYHNVISLNT